MVVVAMVLVATLIGVVVGVVLAATFLLPARHRVVSGAGQLLAELRERDDELTRGVAEVAEIHQRLTWTTEIVYEAEERFKVAEAKLDRALGKLAATGIVGDLREEPR